MAFHDCLHDETWINTLSKVFESSWFMSKNDVHDDFISKSTVQGARQKLIHLVNSRCCNHD